MDRWGPLILWLLFCPRGLWLLFGPEVRSALLRLSCPEVLYFLLLLSDPRDPWTL